MFIKVFKFRGAKGVLSQEGKRYELTVSYKGHYFKKEIFSKKLNNQKIIEIAKDEMRGLVKSRSLWQKIKNYFYGSNITTSAISQIPNSAEKDGTGTKTAPLSSKRQKGQLIFAKTKQV